RVEPYLIDRIETETGAVVYQATPDAPCLTCEAAGNGNRVLTAKAHYQIHSMLQDVIRKGTATRALELKRSDLGGKTGTTNENRDAWFNGYAPALVAVTWLGKDNSKSLGRDETGGHAALPIWIQFMREALRGVAEFEFQKPADLTDESLHVPNETTDTDAGADGQDDELSPGTEAAPRPGSLDKPIESLF
ncbi:MAG: hypothetical protein RLZZ226_1712, partial [Pseudomonadota bacterium]